MHFIGSLFLDNDFSVRINTLYVCNSDNIQNCSTFWFFMVLTIKTDYVTSFILFISNNYIIL